CEVSTQLLNVALGELEPVEPLFSASEPVAGDHPEQDRRFGFQAQLVREGSRAHGLERRSLGFARLADRLEELGVEERDFGQDRRVLELASSLDQLTGTAQGGLELARLSMGNELCQLRVELVDARLHLPSRR